MKLGKVIDATFSVLLIGIAAVVWFRHAYVEPYPGVVLWFCSGGAIGGLLNLGRLILRRPNA